MATLEDAAEELVVKLRGLDSEIEESEHTLDDLKQRVDTVTDEVEQEWTALAAAAKSFLEKVGEEREHLHQQAEQTLQDVVDAQNTVSQDGAQSRQEIEEGRAGLDALGQHANGLELHVESLATDAGEAPAHDLAERVRELEQQLEHVVQEAQAFVRDEAVPGIEDLASAVKERCHDLHQALADEATAALQQTFETWKAQVDGLEEHVATQGFQVSQQNAGEVVAYALEECGTAARAQLDAMRQMVGVLQAQLKELATDVEQSGNSLVDQAGHELTQELERTHAAAAHAVTALDRVKQNLSAYSFVEV